MSVIYQPAGRAHEYAEWACNIYGGCGHGCHYCYVPTMPWFDEEKFAYPEPRKDTFFKELEKDAVKLAGLRERVLLCFTCDPYQPLEGELQHTRRTIEILQAHDIRVQILTKGGTRALSDLRLLAVGDNAYAATLTYLSNEMSTRWEPGAALPANRIAALQRFHGEGVETWVSLEPVLNPAVALDIIGATHEFVDYFKVGKLNYSGKLPPRLRSQVADIDWGRFAGDVVNLLEDYDYERCYQPHDISQGQFYIKNDLAKFLPITEMPEVA